jgi:hypothetical protein
MRPPSWPSWLLGPTVLLLLPANRLAEDAVCYQEEDCGQRVSRYDDIFDDNELSLSLLQRKAKQIQSNAQRAALEMKEASDQVETQAEPGADSLKDSGQESVTVSTMQMPPIAMDFVSLSKFDSQSRLYLFHQLSTTIRERGQIAVFILGGGFLLMLFLASSATGACRKKDQVLQVQVRVDHFVTHSLTSKRIVEAPVKASTQMSQMQMPSKLPPDEETTSENLCTSVITESEPPVQEDIQEQCPGQKPVQNSAIVCPVELRKGTPALIDPVFLLPLCETWYAVCVEPMSICDGSFDILRIAGYPRLHGRVQHADGRRVLEITCSSMPAKQGQVLASVAIEDPARVVDQACPGILEVAAAGKPYGAIRPVAERSYTLACDKEDVMTLSTEDGRQLVLRCAEDEKILASASWFEQSDFFSGAGHLAIRVNPNVDTILVLSCALALTILGQNKNLIQCKRPADRGAG